MENNSIRPESRSDPRDTHAVWSSKGIMYKGGVYGTTENTLNSGLISIRRIRGNPS